jgi:hypothetical protein
MRPASFLKDTLLESLSARTDGGGISTMMVAAVAAIILKFLSIFISPILEQLCYTGRFHFTFYVCGGRELGGAQT